MKVLGWTFICVVVWLSCFSAASTPNAPDALTSLGAETAQVEASFSRINFTFQSSSDAETYFNEKHYKSCMIAGVKLDVNGEIYVSIPRWKDNVPSTLNKVIKLNDEFSDEAKYILQPYPSWDMNTVGDPNALQSVLGFEIDDKGRMWILDQGKVNGEPAIPNSIKLVIWDIKANSLVKRFVFPESMASLSRSFMNDVVVDTTRDIAYIADSGISVNSTDPLLGALFVYELQSNTAVRLLDGHVSVREDPSLWITINGEHVNQDAPMKTGADGIALSCDRETLYYTPLSSRTLYAVKTADVRAVMKNEMTESAFEKLVVKLGYKRTASDGLSYSNDNYLYVTALEESSVLRIHADQIKWEENGLDYRQLETVVANNDTMQWPDTIGFHPSSGRLYFVSNQLQHFLGNEIDFDTDPNAIHFRVWSVDVDGKSYVGGCVPSHSDDDDDGDGDKGMPWWGYALVIGGLFCIIIVVFVVLKMKKGKKQRKKHSLDDPSHSLMAGYSDE